MVSPTQLTAVTPAASPGPAIVSVTTPWGTGSLANGFTYVNIVVPGWATLVAAAPDPAVVTSMNLRNAIIATGHAWRVRHTQTQIEMLLIPPGAFSMGCSPSNQYGCYFDGRESPIHAVTLTNTFYLGRYEVTQAQWASVMGANPSQFASASIQVPAEQVSSRPVEQVSWNMVQGFNTATGLRLPTEAEWEYAYRAGTTTAFHAFSGYPNGTNTDTLIGNIAWFGSNSGSQSRPVGLKQANGLGLHDMSGNIEEWVSDWFGFYPADAQVNPAGPSSGQFRLLRGGSWSDNSGGCRSSSRVGQGSVNGADYYAASDRGFRVARNP